MKVIKKVNKKQCMEFGQVITLVTLFFALRFINQHLVLAAFVLLLITVLMPIIFYPLAVLWFGLSCLLSKVGPPVLLTVIFFVVVTPVGLLRRLWKHDNLRLKEFKKDKQSVMVDRNHLYTKDDLLHSF